MARNAYSFAHMPLAVGIVLAAFGLKEVLLYVSDSSHHELTDPLPPVALAALVGGVVIYLLAHVVFKWLTVHSFSVVRLAAAGALLLTIPLIAGRPALVELGVVALVVTGAVLIESSRVCRLPAQDSGGAGAALTSSQLKAFSPVSA